MRQLLTKAEWFILFNVIAIVALYLAGVLRLEGVALLASFISLLVVNVAALISANRYKDWKK